MNVHPRDFYFLKIVPNESEPWPITYQSHLNNYAELHWAGVKSHCTTQPILSLKYLILFLLIMIN